MAVYNVGGINPFNREKTIYDALSKALSDDDVNWLKSEKYEGPLNIYHGIHLIGASKTFKIPEHSVGLNVDGSGNLVIKNVDLSVTALANALQIINWNGDITLENCSIGYAKRVRPEKAYPLFVTNGFSNANILIDNCELDGVNIKAASVSITNSKILSSKETSVIQANNLTLTNVEVDNVEMSAGHAEVNSLIVNERAVIGASSSSVSNLNLQEKATLELAIEEANVDNLTLNPSLELAYFRDGTYNFTNSAFPDAYIAARNANIEFGDNIENEANWAQDNVTFANVGSEKIDFVETKKSAIEQLNEMIGLENVKEQLEKYVAAAKISKARASMNLENKDMGMHLIFGGSPGTGKTVVANLVAQALYEEGVIAKPTCVVGSRANLISKFVGETPEKTKAVLESARGGVFFLDEAHRFTSMSSKDHANEAMGEILTFAENERDDILIILAGYTENLQQFFEKGDPGMRSRFSNWIEFPDYSFEELNEIALFMFDDYTLTPEAKDKLKFNLFSFYNKGMVEGNARFVRNFVEAVIMEQHLRLSRENNMSKEALITIEGSDIQKGYETLYQNLNRK